MTLRRWPLVVVALAAALLVCAAFAVMVSTGERGWWPNGLKPLLAPGLLSFYVVGTFTGSAAASLVVFVAGTVATYVGVGWLGDLLWHAVRGRRRRSIAGAA